MSYEIILSIYYPFFYLSRKTDLMQKMEKMLYDQFFPDFSLQRFDIKLATLFFPYTTISYASNRIVVKPTLYVK